MADAQTTGGPDALARTLFFLVAAGAVAFVAAIFLFAL